MSQYVNDIPTAKSLDEIEVTVTSFLGNEGFEPQVYHGEQVWKKGHGLLTGPQFIKIAPHDGHIHFEAWIKFGAPPGRLFRESGTTGLMGVAIKKALAQRVNTLEQALTTQLQTPAQWYPDPAGRHEHRYWDGQGWTDQVSDAGVESADPLPGPSQQSRPGAPQQKTPRRGGGALLGLLQGGEICISIYVDPWEVGGPGCAVGAHHGKRWGPYVRRGAQPRSLCRASSSVSPLESLNSIRTYVRFVCESDHRPLQRGHAADSGPAMEAVRAERGNKLHRRPDGSAERRAAVALRR